MGLAISSFTNIPLREPNGLNNFHPNEPMKPENIEKFKDDRVFLQWADAALASFQMSYNGPDESQKVAEIKAALANTDLSTLTPEERAQILQAIRTGGLVSGGALPGPPYYAGGGILRPSGNPIVNLINKLSNNQGYTGPGANNVVATVPTQGNGQMNITQGQLLDNENFGALADQVYLANGGKPPQLGHQILGLGGMPSAMLNGSRPFAVANLDNWSEAERIRYLQAVAEYAKDGKLDAKETEALRRMVMEFNTQGESQPTAVVGVHGKPLISKDDLMENSTFKDKLTQMATGFFGHVSAMGQPDELQKLIASADYDKLSYSERVLLMQALDKAKADFNITNAERADIVRMFKGFLTTDEQSSNKMAGQTLSNGTFISYADVATSDNFASQAQQVLQQSGVQVTASGENVYAPHNFNNISIPQLIGLDTSKLSAQQRIEVLEMIASAAADGTIDRNELLAIHRKVDPTYPNMPFFSPSAIF